MCKILKIEKFEKSRFFACDLFSGRLSHNRIKPIISEKSFSCRHQETSTRNALWDMYGGDNLDECCRGVGALCARVSGIFCIRKLLNVFTLKTIGVATTANIVFLVIK